MVPICDHSHSLWHITRSLVLLKYTSVLKNSDLHITALLCPLISEHKDTRIIHEHALCGICAHESLVYMQFRLTNSQRYLAVGLVG